MDVADLERVYEAFQDFHDYFAPAFGRQQWREHSRHYLQGLLVQFQERRNAENLSEMVPVSPRAMQRFLAEARWDDDSVIGRLQEYLGSRLDDPQAVWVLAGSDFPKQGVKSVGVARQYCGALGKIANCQAGVFLAHVGCRRSAVTGGNVYASGDAAGRLRACRVVFTFHHTMSGVMTMVGRSQGSHTGFRLTLTTITAVTVAMVPAIMLVR